MLNTCKDILCSLSDYVYNFHRVGGNHVIKIPDFGLTQDITKITTTKNCPKNIIMETVSARIRWMSMMDTLFSEN